MVGEGGGRISPSGISSWFPFKVCGWLRVEWWERVGAAVGFPLRSVGIYG